MLCVYVTKLVFGCCTSFFFGEGISDFAKDVRERRRRRKTSLKFGRLFGGNFVNFWTMLRCDVALADEVDGWVIMMMMNDDGRMMENLLGRAAADVPVVVVATLAELLLYIFC